MGNRCTTCILKYRHGGQPEMHEGGTYLPPCTICYTFYRTQKSLLLRHNAPPAPHGFVKPDNILMQVTLSL